MNNEDIVMQEIVEIIQDIAIKTIAGRKPLEVRIGYVKSDKPLIIELMGKFCISESSLILSDNVKDKYVDVEIDFTTEMASSHRHSVSGIKTVCIKNSLKVGDRVLMLRTQGGEKHIVVNKI